MKTIITMLCVLLVLATSAQQKVIKDAQGNYSAAIKAVLNGTTKVTDTPTGKTYTDAKGTVYPVYVSINGNLYILRISRKTGNIYKQYLKL